MNILVLGHNGMLGHTVRAFLETQKIQTTITDFKFDTEEFRTAVLTFDGNFIINCIGCIPQKKQQNFKINTDLPIWLSNNSKCNIIHPSTDCELDNNLYGKSKNLASEYLKLYSTNTKILKTSIIGPEKNSNYELMSWFSCQHEPVHGWINALWNGNTTLEWSKQCLSLINNWESYSLETILEGESVSKYELLHLFNEFYNKNIHIIPTELGKDKRLFGGIKTKRLRLQLQELREFMEQNNISG